MLCELLWDRSRSPSSSSENGGGPIVCNDGVTIAKEIKLKDPEENLGAQMMRQAAEKTGDLVGDGTSTATLLAEAIFSEGIRNVVAGASAIDIRRGLDIGMRAAVEELRGLSRPVKSPVEKAQVATISAHNDADIGRLVAEAIEKVGDEGAITVEDSRTTDTVLEVVEGMQFDRGYISPYSVTETEHLTCDLENTLVLLHDKKLSSLRPLIPFLESVAKQNLPLLVIAEDVILQDRVVGKGPLRNEDLLIKGVGYPMDLVQLKLQETAGTTTPARLLVDIEELA